MIIEHIKSSDLETKKWSGGTTIQLAIHPIDADYRKQDFQFRISTATVETEESIFTKLSGVSRQLMILDGEIKIEHQNHYSKNLKKFEQDQFSGDWNTKSFGKAIDFNLMTKGNTEGEIEAIPLESSDNKLYKLNSEYTGIYIYKGQVNLIIDDQFIDLSKGDFVNILNQESDTIIEITASVLSEIILTKINLQ